MDVREPVPSETQVEKPVETTLGAVTIPIGTSLEEMERILIEHTLAATRGNKKRAAELLGLSRSTLYAKLEKYLPSAVAPNALPGAPRG